jgi:hypothetical protein
MARQMTPRLAYSTVPLLPETMVLYSSPIESTRFEIDSTGGVSSTGGAWDPAKARVVTVFDSPRVRLVYNIVTAAEAAELIALGGPNFYRSSTARSAVGAESESRTSESTMLPTSNPTVERLRQRMAAIVECTCPCPWLRALCCSAPLATRRAFQAAHPRCPLE